MSYTKNRFLGDDVLPQAQVTRSPWVVLGMFGVLTGMAVFFSKEMDKKTLKKNRRR